MMSARKRTRTKKKDSHELLRLAHHKRSTFDPTKYCNNATN